MRPADKKCINQKRKVFHFICKFNAPNVTGIWGHQAECLRAFMRREAQYKNLQVKRSNVRMKISRQIKAININLNCCTMHKYKSSSAAAEVSSSHHTSNKLNNKNNQKLAKEQRQKKQRFLWHVEGALNNGKQL